MEMASIDTTGESLTVVDDEAAQRLQSIEAIRAISADVTTANDALHDTVQTYNLKKKELFKGSPSKDFFPVDAITILIVLQCVKYLVVGNFKQTMMANGLLGLGYLYRMRRENRLFGDLLIPALIQCLILFTVCNPYLISSLVVGFIGKRQTGQTRSVLLTISFVLTSIYYSKRLTAKQHNISDAAVDVTRAAIDAVTSRLPPMEDYPSQLRKGLELPKVGAVPVIATSVLVLATLMHSNANADATMLQVLTRSARSSVVA